MKRSMVILIGLMLISWPMYCTAEDGGGKTVTVKGKVEMVDMGRNQIRIGGSNYRLPPDVEAWDRTEGGMIGQNHLNVGSTVSAHVAPAEAGQLPTVLKMELLAYPSR